MALTNQQVQQAYLAILGRPAEAEAVLWGSLATDVPGLINTIIYIRGNGVDFNKDNTIFVENLYLNLLGRSSDEEGLSFWVAALNNGTSYGDLVTSFIASAASSLTDLYTLQNKLSLAEQISLQVKSIKGGAPAEAKLKEIMNTIDGETSIDDIQEDINTFLGQYNNAQKVTVKPGAEEPTQGSDEYASTYNATIKLGDENSTINIEGSSVFDDTLNLTVKGSADNNTFNSSDLGQVSNIASVNLNLRDSRLTASNIDTSHFGADTIKIKGNSADSVVVNNAMSLLDTGDGNDDITINQALDTLLAGAGNDKVVVNAKVTSLQTGAGDDNISVNSQVTNLDAGAGNDTIDLTSSAKVSKLNAGAGDDIIKISQKANIKNATIDGGAGNNSLKLYDGQVDLTNTTLNGINALSGEARLKAAQLSAKSLVLGVEQLDDSFEGTGVIDTAKIELQAQTGGIDLSGLTIAEDSAGHELKIVDVKNSSIKLSDDNLGNSDESDSTKVEIYGTDGNDQITLEAGKVSLLDSLKGNDTITISQAASVAILNANDGKNTISVAGKVGSLNTGADADSISVSGEVQTIKAGDGDDSIDLASSSKVSNIDAGAGNDTISVSGQVSKEINAGAGNDIININQGSKIFTLNAGEGDDTINIQRGADLNSAKIDGGSGFNSLKLSNGQVDLSKASLNNINAISGEGKLNANQVNNKALTLGTEQTNSYGDLNGLFDSANLTIQADKSTSNLSLNNLKIAQGSTGHTLNITNVKETSISLNDQNLGNQDIDDLENYATKVNVTSTENKDNITLSNGKFATVDTSGGNDTINVESSASVATLKAGEGNDTINVKGAVKDLDASEGNDTIVLESGSTTTNINAGAGDDIVRFKSGAAAEVIDGGAGNNTLVLDSGSSVDLTNTTLKNIQVLDGDATLGVDQINGQSFILGGDKDKKVGDANLSGKASLKVSVDDKNINLSNLKSADGVKDNKVELTDVTTAKITLSDAKAGIAETIKLSANASAVEISNIRGGDKIDLAALNVLSSSGGTQTPTALSTSTSKSISSGKLYAYSLTTGSLGDIDSIVSELSSYSAAGKALLAINQDGKAHLYQVSAGKISASSLKLLAITDAEINIGNAKVSGSSIELQGSNVVTITKDVTQVTSTNQADTVFVGAVSISGSGSSAKIDGAPTSGHSITGSANYNDTLAIDITGSGSGTNKLDDDAWKQIIDPNKVKDVENLTLGANSVEVDLTLNNTNGNFQNEVTITGTGTTKLQVQQNTEKISLGSGSGDVTVSGAKVGALDLGGGQNTLKVQSGGNIGEVTSSASGDTITISGSGSVDKITTNGGADSITLSDGGKLGTLEASKSSDTVTVSGSGSLSNITGEGKVTIGDNTTLDKQLDIGSYKNELTISGSSANVKNLLADNNKIKLEANSQIEKLQIKDGGNVSVSGSGSVTFDTTNNTGDHAITIGKDTTLKEYKAGSGDDSITIANGGKLSGASIDFKNGDNILNVMSGGSIDELTTIKTGNGNSNITINAGATATKLANINLGNGNNTLTLGVSGATSGLTVSGGSGTDNITVLTSGKIDTLNAGANTTNLDLQTTGGITNINTNSAGSTINIKNNNQADVIAKITGNSGSDVINLGKNMTVSEIETGTGALSVNGEATITKLTVSANASGDITIGTNTKTTVTEVVASGGGSKVTLKGNGEVNKLNLSGNTTEDITIGNGVAVKEFTTDATGTDTITVANGGKLDMTSLNFSGGTSNLTVENGGDISTITSIEMGQGTSSIDLQSGAKADKLTTIDLGSGNNTLKVGVSGDATSGLTVKGNSGTDTIEVSAGGKITTLDAGQDTTNITLSGGGTIGTINAENAQGSTIKVEGQGTITNIVGKDQADNITLGDGITLGTYTGGSGDDTLNLSGATVNTISAGKDNTTISGDSTKKGEVNELKTDASADAHTINITNATVNKITAGTGNDTITLGEGGALGNAQNTEIDFNSGANTLTINSGGDISALTRIDMGDNGNASVTINEGAKLGTTIIELGSASTTGTGNKNTFTLKANGENLTVQGTSSDEEINVSGADAKLGTLNAGAGTTQITLNDNANITTINAENAQGSTIKVEGQGTITNIVGKDQADNITLGKDITVTTYTGGTGDDNINLSGATITTLDTNTGNTTITGDAANKGTIENLKTDGAAANETRTISVKNTTINNLVAGNGDDAVTIGTGAVLKGDSEINFGNGSNTLTIDTGGKIESATKLIMKSDKNDTNKLNVSGDISSLTSIEIGGGEGSYNNAITLANTATIGTNLNITLSASLGDTPTGLENNTLKMNANSTIKKVTGSSIKDNIIVSGTSASINELVAGAGETAINLQESGSITTINANNAENFSLSVSGADITKNIITTISGSDTLDTISVTKATVTTLNAGANSTNLTLSGAAVVTSLNVTKDNSTIDLTSTDSGVISKLSTNGGTGTHTINVGNKIDIKALEAGTGNDILNIKNGGKISAASLDFSGGNNTLSVASGGDISTLTSITMGDGNGTITIDKDATANALKTITLGNGTNNLNIAVSGDTTDGITVSGNSGDDTIILGATGKLKTLNAGTGTTNITIASTNAIETINAETTAGNTGIIIIDGSGTIGKIVSNAATDNITLKKGVSLTTYSGGAGDDIINLSGDSITTIDAGAGNTTINLSDSATVNEIQAHDNANFALIINGTNAVDISGKNADTVKTISGSNTLDTITINKAKVTTFNAGAGDTTINLAQEGNISTLNLGATSNNITISGDGNVTKISSTSTDGVTQQVTIKDGASIGSYVGGSGADVITIENTADLKSKVINIQTGSGADTITIKEGVTFGVNSKIDFGTDGSGKLKLEGANVNLTTMLSNGEIKNVTKVDLTTTTGTVNLGDTLLSGKTGSRVDVTGVTKENTEITLSTAKEAIDVTSVASGSITLNNFSISIGADSTNAKDSVKFTNAKVATNATDQTVADITEISTASIKNGMLTCKKDNGDVTLTLDQAKLVLTKISVNAHDVVAFKSGNDSYLINVGANASSSDDDIVIKLAGVSTTSKIETLTGGTNEIVVVE